MLTLMSPRASPLGNSIREVGRRFGHAWALQQASFAEPDRLYTEAEQFQQRAGRNQFTHGLLDGALQALAEIDGAPCCSLAPKR